MNDDFSLYLDLVSPSAVECYELLLRSQTIVKNAQDIFLSTDLLQAVNSFGTCFASGFIAGASQAEEDKAHARILKTTDGGKSWRAVFDSDRPGDNNWKLAFPSARVGYATIISYQAPANEARGYVVKSNAARDLLAAVEAVSEHRVFTALNGRSIPSFS